MNFFKKIPFFWLITIIIILPGIFVAADRCMLRIKAEQKNIFVETVADLDEFRLLARKDGLTLEELFKKLKESGASSVCASEDTLSSLESEGKITVLNSKEIRKLSLEETYEIKLPNNSKAVAGLWIHSDDDRLLDRINQNLLWRFSEDSLIRIHNNLLLINKSGQGITEKVGLGFSDEYFELAAKNNLAVVARVYNFPNLSFENAAKIIGSFPPPASVSALIFADEEMFGNRGDLNNIIKLFKIYTYRLGWIEFDIQEGIKNYLKVLTSNHPFVRVHAITRKEMDQVYSPKRAIARWVRAVKDRSLKMLYFNCFFQDEDKYISNLTEYNLKYLKDTVEELKKSGFQIANSDKERFYEPRLEIEKTIPAEVIAMGVALFLGLPMLLRLSFFPKLDGVFSLLLSFIVVLFFCFFPEKFRNWTSLIGAITYSSIGFLVASDLIRANKYGFLKNTIRYIFFLIFPSIIGGILIAGLYSNPNYLLKFDQFHGIKLAFLIPLMFSVIWSLKKYGKNVFELVHKPMTIITVLIVGVVAVSIFLYILRSDNTTLLKPTALEDRGRTFLENTLISRPRNKEFLVGYPAAMIFVMLLMHKELVLLPLLALFIQMGQVSVVNTFCHFHSPLLMTILRTFNGLWLGFLIGLTITFVYRFLQLVNTYGLGKKKRVFLIGYFGFANTGDELLRYIYTKKFFKYYKEYEISVLTVNSDNNKNTEKVNWIFRKDYSGILEELIKCEAVVVPGGGVFQSSTSNRSLFYYTFIIWLAKLFKTKVILIAQGLGPWKNKGIISNWIHSIFSKELKKADYLTVRDNNSFYKYKEITSPEAYVEITTDLAFLNDEYLKKKTKNKIEFMHIYAVIRSSVKGADKIASDLIRLTNESENIKLVPVAFQNGEDSYVWRRVGWKGDIKNVDNYDNTFDEADLVISMRLHGCIIATNQSIPWIGISYDPKVSSFAESCGWNEFCCNPEEANMEFFEKCINKMAYDYINYSNKLTKFAEKMHKVAENDFQRSLDVITKDNKK